jgi:hypothetical protein
MATRMQQRRGTAAQWTAANPVLAAGEIGFETDTNKFKMGNGSSAWSALQYFANAAELAAIIDGAPELLNTLNELAAAFGDDPNFLSVLNVAVGEIDETQTIHGLATTNVHGIANTSNLATQADIANAITAATVDQESLAGTGIEWNAVDERFDIDSTIATKTYADDAVTAHNADETNVHGIADTSALATKTYADDAVTTHNSDATNVHGIEDTALLATKAYSDSALGLHNDDTTSVHGIADTSALATKTYADDAVSSHNAVTINVHGIANTALLATKSYADDALSAHNNVTTNVHGIADTSLLATKSYADTAEADAITAAGTAADSKVAAAVAALTKTSVGLANVDNTSDADKPVSTATQTALNAKASLAGATFTGNVEVDGNLVVDGDFTVNGTNFSASATSITIEDNMVQLAHQNAANTVDLGLVVAYNDGTAKHSGIVRDVSADKWKLFKGVTTEPSTTVDFTQGSLDALQVAALEATTVTPSAGVVFSDGTQTKEGVPSRTPIVQKTASYALSQLTHRDSLIEVDSTSATTLTIPLDSTVDYPIGTTIDILQTNTGQVTIAPVSGSVTVNATPGLKLRTRWSSATLLKRAANTWVVYGDLTA